MGAIEQKVARLDQRVSRLESKAGLEVKSDFSWNESLARLFSIKGEDFSRIIGWFLLTVSFLALVSSWLEKQAYNPLLALLLFIGLWMVGRTSSFFDLSDTAREIAHQARVKKDIRTATLHHGQKMHRSPVSEAEEALALVRNLLFSLAAIIVGLAITWLVLNYVPNAAAQTLLLCLLPVATVVYSLVTRCQQLLVLSILVTYGILLLSLSPIFAVLAAGLITLGLVYVAVSKQQWQLLLFVLVLAYGSLARWVIPVVDPTNLLSYGPNYASFLSLAITVSLLVYLLLFALPFIWRQREAEEREVARGIIFGNAASFTALSLWLLSFGHLDGWFLTHFITLFVSTCFAYVAWLFHGRYSYAKYFGILSIVAILAILSIQSDKSLADLTWLAISVILLTAGFVASSYTLRMGGLVALVVACAYYLVNILPPLAGLVSGQDVAQGIWLGGMLTVFLIVVGSWYKDLKPRGSELKYRDTIIQAAYIGSGLIVACWVEICLTGFAQSLAWIAIAAVMLLIAGRQKYAFLQATCIALFIVSLIKIALADSRSVGQAQQIEILLGLAVFLVLAGYAIARYPRQAAEYLK